MILSAVFPVASREEVVRRKLRDPELAAEKHSRPCCQRQGLQVPAALAPESATCCAEPSKVAADLAASAWPTCSSVPLECPRQIRDDQKQRQCRKKYCENDLLHYILLKIRDFVVLTEPETRAIHRASCFPALGPGNRIAPTADSVCYRGIRWRCDSRHVNS